MSVANIWHLYALLYTIVLAMFHAIYFIKWACTRKLYLFYMKRNALCTNNKVKFNMSLFGGDGGKSSLVCGFCGESCNRMNVTKYFKILPLSRLSNKTVADGAIIKATTVALSVKQCVCVCVCVCVCMPAHITLSINGWFALQPHLSPSPLGWA